MARVHVVGAGLAGLAAAVTLVRRARPVTLYEASGHAGGRCRSYYDTRLERLIDNGNHLLLSGNRAAKRYLEEIGATDRLSHTEKAEFPFFDLASGLRWTLRPGSPLWILSKRRGSGTYLAEIASALKLLTAKRSHTIAERLQNAGSAYTRFWKPLAESVLNTPCKTGSAALLRRVLVETLLRGETACRPRIALKGLSHAFVDPAVDLLTKSGTRPRFHFRLKALRFSANRVTTLIFANEPLRIPAGDQVILALPPWDLKRILPTVRIPDGEHAIVNAHFRLPRHAKNSFLGLIGGTAQWLFVRGDVASATVSAADDLAEKSPDRIAKRIWLDIGKVLQMSPQVPPHWRIIKEKRATFAQTPANERCRPKTRTGIANVFLAGDWIATGLPATIESAVLSGQKAALAALKSDSG